MSHEEVDVDRIVQAVLARLQQRSAVTAAKPASAANSTGQPELVLWGGLVTEQDLMGQLRAERVVRVAAGTVLTPSARDYLRTRGVTLATIAHAPPQHKSIERRKVVLGVAHPQFEASGIVTNLTRHHIHVEQLARVGLIGVVEELVDHVGKGGDRGLLFTDRPLAATCLANRTRGVRAAAVGNHEEARQASQEIGANLLIVNPTATSSYAMLHAVRTWCGAPATTLPVELRERLG